MIGRTLAHYTVVEKIGEGGMGEVYRATDARLKRDVALKVLPPALASDAQRLARFQQEAESVAALNHPNIVTVFSVEEADGIHLMTMELVQGQSLDCLIPVAGFPLPELISIATALAGALSAAHEKGIVHRDLKPANVMLTDQDRVKVLDFGLAKIGKEAPAVLEATPASRVELRLTADGVVMGTVPYMAPEQLQGEDVDARADLFSLGVMLYELATGVHPFPGDSAPQIMASILGTEAAPVRDRRADLPEDLERIVGRCLIKEPKRRYQTARDVENDLEDLQRRIEWGAEATAPPRVVPLASDATAAVSTVDAALTAYREGRIREWTDPRYRLDREFVALTLLVDQGEETASGRWSAQPKTHRDLGDLMEQVNDPALVVLGPPGCGKSTLLRRLELDLAQVGLTDPEQPITFFIQLNQYRGKTSGEPPPDPESWLGERWNARYPELPPLSALLRAGRMVLLLDALNEVPTTRGRTLRQSVLEWKEFLARMVAEHAGNRVVFSCRTLDYSAPLSTPELRVPQVVIEPMRDEQVEQFLLKHSPAQGEAIWCELRDTPQRELMRSPYFLLLLVEYVHAMGEVPRGRAGLFTGFVRRSLTREVERDNPLFAPDGLLTERDLRRITRGRWRSEWEVPEHGILLPKLSDLAFRMQSRSAGGGASQVRIAYDDALELLEHEQDEDILRAGFALSVLEEDAVTEEVMYVHQLVQEYFAGRYLARAPDPERVRAPWKARDIEPPLAAVLETLAPGESLPPLDTTGWEETEVLGAAMAEDPDAYVRDLMETNLPVSGRAVGQVEVRERLNAELLHQLRLALAQRSRERSADLRARIEAGLALGPLGDPRFEEGEGPFGAYLLPPLVTIPGGVYPMGDDEVFEYLGQRVESHIPRHEVNVASFGIGKYPVTNAEWKRFMMSGGYEDPNWWDTPGARRWWSGEGTADGTHLQVRYWLGQFREDPSTLESAWARGEMPEESYERWKKRLVMSESEFAAHLQELYPGGRQREPRFWSDGRFNNPSQPVVGLSWFEARAYCTWLGAQTGRAYRLPTEVEWEVAARGKEARQYAWGDGFGPFLGNTAAARMGQTTPVGVFVDGDTPEGVSDLTGNVGEWTSSLFGSGMEFEKAAFAYPYRSSDGREDPEAGPEVRRVLRGGAWSNGPTNSRSAYRSEVLPGGRVSVSGFRIAVSPPVSTHG